MSTKPLLGALAALLPSLTLALPPPEVSFSYSRSLDGAIAEQAALRAYATASNAYAKAASYGPMTSPPSTTSSSTERILWAAPPHRFILERTTSSTGRILTLRATSEPLLANPPQRPTRTSKDTPVILDIPLLRQTTQGTCAPITIASLLQFYGIPCTETDLEKAIPTSSTDGTDVELLLSHVNSTFLPHTGLSLHTYLGFEADRFIGLLSQYNQQADKIPNTPRLYWKPPTLHLDRTFARADFALFHKVANAQPERKLFWRAIQRSINNGHPLLWGVLLGAVPEPKLQPSQSLAGHLRLIVGYCDATQTIYFSDPWGPTHSAKPLPLPDAWTETLTLHALSTKP